MSGTDSPTGSEDPARGTAAAPGASTGGSGAPPRGTDSGTAGTAAVEEYIAGFPELARALLQDLRDLARAVVPQATEAVKWNAPAYVHPGGTILFQVSGHRDHANAVFTPGVLAAFEDELVNHETGKGSVRLYYGQPVPHDLLERMMLARVREYEDQGITWM